MTSRAPRTRGRRAHRWPLLGACLWLFLMTLFGAEVAGAEQPGLENSPDEGWGQGTIAGQADRGRGGTGL